MRIWRAPKMLDGQRLERWLWLAAFAAVLLVSRSISVTIHQAPEPREGRDAPPGPAASSVDRASAERALREAEQALKEAECRYEEAQDRLQEFEERHLETLLGADVPLPELRIERDREKLEHGMSEIQRLEGEIKQLAFTICNLDRELIEYDRVENPKYAPIAAEVQSLEAALTAFKANRPIDHPMVRQKQEIYRARKQLLDNTPRYLRNQEIRRPNPRWEEVNTQRERAEADLMHQQRLRVGLTERIQQDEQRLKALPGIRREHGARREAVILAREEFERARRRHREAVRASKRLATPRDA